MKLFGQDGTEIMNIASIERSGSDMVLKGKIMGHMQISAVLHPQEARKAFGLLGFKIIPFLITFLFRK